MSKWIIQDQDQRNLESLKKNNHMYDRHISIQPSLLLVILLIFALVQVLMLNRYSTVGQKLNKFDSEIRHIEGENSKMVEKIASSSSIATIFRKASSAGLVNTTQTVSLESPLPVAYNIRFSL